MRLGRVMMTAVMMLAVCCTRLMAQADPTLSAMILLYDLNMSKQLKSQEAVMLLETTGHIWTKNEVEATKDLQQEFNNYLNSFNTVIAYAAETYGFYHETRMLVGNMKSLTDELADHPSGALAVALSSRRNDIYREIIMNSADIVNDIRQVCLSDIKMTEKERIETFLGIRPKMKRMNRSLLRLTRAVRYTSMSDVWAEISGVAYGRQADVSGIAGECLARWQRNSRRFDIDRK